MQKNVQKMQNTSKWMIHATKITMKSYKREQNNESESGIFCNYTDNNEQIG